MVGFVVLYDMEGQVMGDSANIRDMDDTSFDALSREKRFAFVFVDAAWCSPARMLTPVIKELAAERTAVDLGFYRIDSDVSLGLMSNLPIPAIPTVLMLKDGKVADKLVGSAPKAKLAALIDRVVTPSS